MSATANKLLADAAARGLTLLKNGGKIVYVGHPDAMTEDLATRLRAHRAELLRVLPDESEKPAEAQAPRQPDAAQAPAGDRTGRVLHTHYGAGYQHPDGRVETGTPEPTPPPAEPWSQDLDGLLRRVSCAFEWSAADRRDFIAWARRSPDGMADARAFLAAECAKLPAPGRLTEPRRPAAGTA